MSQPKPNLVARVRLMPGTTVREAVTDALHLARELECYVEFDFNGRYCLVSPNDSLDKRVEALNVSLGLAQPKE